MKGPPDGGPFMVYGDGRKGGEVLIGHLPRHRVREAIKLTGGKFIGHDGRLLSKARASDSLIVNAELPPVNALFLCALRCGEN